MPLNPIQDQGSKRDMTLKEKMHEVIFEADTRDGKFFDVVLLIAIIISSILVMMESVKEYQQEWGHLFTILEWSFTILFTLEYLARIFSVRKPLKYIFSFWGMIDLLSILPSYLGLFIRSARTLRVIRVIRLLRIFRIFKLGKYMKEADFLRRAMVASRWKIVVFLGTVITICILMGTLMYVVEGDYQPGKGEGFTSIPRSIYWAIVTLTTVGYGDISPVTPVGQAISSVIMIMGYAILAVPTGIVSVELNRELNKSAPDTDFNTQCCPSCSKEGHDSGASFCKFCGDQL